MFFFSNYDMIKKKHHHFSKKKQNKTYPHIHIHIHIQKKNIFFPSMNDESPFAPFQQGRMVTLYLEPILHAYTKSYMNVLTLDAMPEGPLADMVVHTTFPKLSPFQTIPAYTASPFPSCTHVLCRYRGGGGGFNKARGDQYMFAEDIPSVFGYLRNHGYTIETDLTKLTFDSSIDVGRARDRSSGGRRRMVCMLSYNP